LLTVSCIGAATVVGYVYWKTGQFHRANVALDPVAAPGQPRNYLLIGSDTRAGISPDDPNAGALLGSPVDGARSDTILIARVDPVAKTIQLLSIPRDLWVVMPGTDQHDRINAAYGVSPQHLVDAIRQNLGIPINNYISVDFAGFQRLVDAIGGVPIWFNTAVRDDNTGLSISDSGCYNLNGEQALAFARSRHLYYRDSRGQWVYDGTSDFGRTTRQRLFVERAMQKVLSLNLGDIVTLNQLLNVAVDSVTIDQTLTRSDLLALSKQFKALGSDTTQSYAVPTTNYTTPAGAQVLLLDANGARPVLNIFRGLPPEAISEHDITVNITDGAGRNLNSLSLVEAFAAAGFQTGTHTAQRTVSHTTLRYAPGSEAAADLVNRHLIMTAQLQPDPQLPADTITVIAGNDIGTIAPTAAPPTTTTTTPAGTPPTLPPTTPPPNTITGFNPGNPPPGTTC
jgi:LCP family protein required for cell wall assembly